MSRESDLYKETPPEFLAEKKICIFYGECYKCGTDTKVATNCESEKDFEREKDIVRVDFNYFNCQPYCL